MHDEPGAADLCRRASFVAMLFPVVAIVRGGSSMRLAVLSRFPPAECGIAEYSWFLTSAILSIRSDLEVVVLGNKDVPQEEVRGAAHPRLRIERVFVSASNEFGEILSSLKLYEPEVLHIQHDYSFFPQTTEFLEFLEKARRYCNKIVVTMHTVKKPIGMTKAVSGLTTFRQGIKEDFELILFQRKLVERVDVVIVHSYLQEFELWCQGVDHSKIQIVPHGTLINPYTTRSKYELLEELKSVGIHVDPRGHETIVFLPGFIRYDKGLDIAIKTFDIVSRKCDVMLILGGAPQGAGSEVLRSRIGELASRRSRIVFVDRFLKRDELLKLLAISDVVILPYREPPGLIGVSGVLHLAIGSFKPLVCTRVPRLVEYCERVPELCAKQNDVAEFAYKLLNLVNNMEEYRRLLEPVWRYAVETRWDKIAAKHLEIYGVRG